MGRRVFISHSGRDTWIAKQIAARMAALGVDTFLDEASIPIGEDFEAQILEFLDRADELLVLLTPWALDRPYVWAEVGAAWVRRIPIVTVLYGLTIEELQSRSQVPILVKRRDLIDLNDVELYFEQLKERASRGSVS